MKRMVTRRFFESEKRRPSRATMIRESLGLRSSETRSPRRATCEALMSSTYMTIWLKEAVKVRSLMPVVALVWRIWKSWF